MRRGPRHPWPRTVPEARRIQEELRARVVARDRLGRVRRVAGVDAAYDASTGTTHAAAALLGFPGLEPLAHRVTRRRTRFPYVPGYLSFRETPALLAALAALRLAPDVILCDAHGLAHPRRFGLACHLGVLLDRPTIGVAKSRLVGTHAAVPGSRGGWTPLRDGGETIGAVLRTRPGVRPVYVSVGHRVSLETAIDLVLRCAPRYRLPEPIRRADALAAASRRGGSHPAGRGAGCVTVAGYHPQRSGRPRADAVRSPGAPFPGAEGGTRCPAKPPATRAREARRRAGCSRP